MNLNKTRELFADLIDRPPLTDQLLQRPPFRFLHDVVNATIKNTGFLMDTFTNEELEASNITDKTSKKRFLKKLIKALNDDDSLKDVKAAKIIAGKEPEMTNLLLQKFATYAAAFRDSQLNNFTRDQKSMNEKVGKNDRIYNKGEQKKNSHYENGKSNREKRHSSKSEKQKRKEAGSELKLNEQNRDSDKQKVSNDEGHSEDFKPETMVKLVDEVHAEPSGTAKTEDSGVTDDMIKEKEHYPVPTDAKEQQRLLLLSGCPRTSASRPGTAAARPPPPKLKKRQIAEIERKSEDIKVGAVIVDERKENDEDFAVEIEQIYDRADQNESDGLVIEEHGGLVRKILETKKELEEKLSNKVHIEQSSSFVFDVKEQAKSQQELENLQRIMQKITQTTHPLARLFDNIQEDADIMAREIEEWRTESRKNLEELREKKAIANGTSGNLLLRLNQLDEQIKEIKSTIARAKANSIANEEKIQTLIDKI